MPMPHAQDTVDRIAKAVIAGLGDADQLVQIEAAATASRISDRIDVRDALIERVSCSPPAVVPHLLSSLVRWLSNEEARARILTAANSGRRGAAMMLDTLEILPFLRALYGFAQEDSQVAQVLLGWLDAAADAPMSKLPEHTDLLLEVLAESGDLRTREALFEFCGSPHPLHVRVYRMLFELVGGDERLLRFLIEQALSGESKALRMRAIRLLYAAFHRTCVRDAMLKVIRTATSAETEITAEAVGVLVPHMGTSNDVFAEVLALANSPHVDVQTAAVRALGPHMYRPAACEAVLSAFSGPGNLRAAALSAICNSLDVESARDSREARRG